ncbi:MAG TPA: RHS repeat-associated core domain-containing protein [Mycobacteriales bacterium]|nr:RHS repeat-associated core domain-containing protein [Mycobacteriales bacterium]
MGRRVQRVRGAHQGHRPAGPGERTVYFPNGDLHERYDVGGLRTTYAADAVGRVAAEVDPLGHETTTTYTDWNQVRTRTTPRGGATTTTYDLDRNPEAVSAPMGRRTAFTYDGSGRLATVTDPEGHVTTLRYDAMSRLREVLGPRASLYTRTFTADGDVRAATDPLDHTTTYTYDNLGNVATVTDPSGVVTAQTYDVTGRPLTRRVGTQRPETRSYDAKGRLRTITSPFGGTVTTTYDRLDRPVLEDDSVRGAVTARTFDDAGRLATATNALGDTTTFGYDASDRLTSAVDAVGTVFRRVFDGGGRLVSDKDGTGVEVTRTYDDDGNPATETNNGDGGVTVYETDLAGRVTAVVDPLGHRTETDYDRLDHVTARRTGDGLRLQETFTYDDSGNRLTHTDRAGKLWRWTYDLANDVRTATTPDGGVSTFGYDGAGRRTDSTDEDGVTSHTDYDTSGRPYRVTDGTAAGVWTTTYDDASPAQARTTRDPDGVTATYAHDGAGRVTSVTDGLGKVTMTTYDGLDAVRTTTDPLGHVTTAHADVRGRPDWTEDALHHRTTYAFDDADRPTLTRHADGTGAETRYDLAGRPRSVTDADGSTYTFGYDLAGQRTKLTTPRLKTSVWTYDDVGNVATETVGGIAATFGYDGEGRLARIERASGRVTTITRDGSGRVLTERGERAATGEVALRTRTYTAAGRPKTLSLPGGDVTFAYNALGLLERAVEPRAAGAGAATVDSTVAYTNAHRVSAATVDGVATTAAYDARGLLRTLTGLVGRTYAYDDAERLSSVTYGGTAGGETFVWDDADRLTRHEQRRGGVTQLTQAYEYTAGDRVSREVQAAPSRGVDRDRTFGYDAVGRLATVTATAADGTRSVETYGWDPDGNRESVSRSTVAANGAVTPLSAVTYTHDGAGRITGASDGTTYDYDADGNLVRTGADTYGYDAFGALSSVTREAANAAAATTVTYGRDALGRLARRDQGATTTAYSYAGASNAVTQTRSPAASSVLVREPAGRVAGVVTGSVASQAFVSRHLDLSGLVDAASGQVSAFAAYEPFGAASGDGAALPVGFQSAVTDPVFGLVDMTARAYSPALGRFTSQDSVVGSLSWPATFNRYAYGAGDPLGSIDPDGHRPFSLGANNPLEDTWHAARDGVRLGVAFLTGNHTARAHALDDLKGDWHQASAWVQQGASALRRPLSALADGVVAPIGDHLRSKTFWRQVGVHAASLATAVAVSGACEAATFGAGSVMCLSLGMAASSALQSYLTCPPGRSGGECAATGAITGLASGVVFGAAANALSTTALRPVVQSVLAGALSGAVGSAVGQFESSGHIDLTRLGEDTVFGGVTAGLAHGVGRALERVGTPKTGPKMPRPSGASVAPFEPPETFLTRNGSLSNGTYTVGEVKMAPHMTGSLAGGKSQFLSSVDAHSAVLDAAAYADHAGLWDINNRAKVFVTNGPVGVHADTGLLTSWINVYRTVTGTVHGSPGAPG